MPARTQVATEFGTLECVAMRYASDTLPHLDGPGIHPVLARQKATSSWTPYTPQKVRDQQDELIWLLRERGTEVVMLPDAPGCSTQHYPRDIGFVIDDTLFAARLNSDHRQPETWALTDPTVGIAQPIPLDSGTIEGGDVLLHDASVLVGLSEETSPAGIAALRHGLAQHRIDREVVPIRFATTGIVHLDDHFTIVAPGTALIHREVFGRDQIAWFDARFTLIDVTDDETRAVRVNVLAIAPGIVVAARGGDRISAAMAAHGIDVLTVDYSEVTRIPGSLRCTTLPLRRS